MATLTDIREQLAVSLANGVANLQASAYLLANPTPPAAEIVPGHDIRHPLTTYDLTMQRGLDKWWLTVRIYVGVPTDIAAQKQLDAMLATHGTGSVKAAIEADPTLGGVAQYTRVTEVIGYRMFDRQNQAPLLGAEWLVEVLAKGDT
jgi:hypothetical protein